MNNNTETTEEYYEEEPEACWVCDGYHGYYCPLEEVGGYHYHLEEVGSEW